MTRHGKALVWQATTATLSILCCVLTLSTLLAVPAEARRYRHYSTYSHRYYPRQVYRQGVRATPRVARRHGAPVDPQAGIAAMVVDANTGRTLYASHEDEIRHPASVTKVMTLYLLFEQLHRGRFTLATPILISQHAAEQPPTKIGLRPGSTISVENAIKAMVTESANDMAVAVAEAVGGTEPAFAALMTHKAHALGMSRTAYVNASGLPDDRQVTTARDLTVLGRAIQEHFPQEYAYFSTRNFVYGGRVHHNHNHLLDQVDGMDGIKTGYTRASGFNLLASVRRNGRHIVSVVLGGRSAPSRDRIMSGLIDQNIVVAAAGGRSAPMIAENDSVEPAPLPFPAAARAVVASVFAPSEPSRSEPAPVAAVEPTAAEPTPSEPTSAAQAIRSAEMSPIAEPVAAPRVQTASLAERPRPAFVSGSPRVAGDQTSSIRSRRTRVIVDGSTGIAPAAYAPETRQAAVRWAAGPSRRQRAAEARAMRREVAAATERSDARIVARAETPRPTARAQTPSDDEGPRSRIARNGPEEAPTKPRAGWAIQIGATDDLAKANELLARARSRDHAALASARPYTEKVQKGSVTLYRARFAVLESSQAEAACRTLKRQGFACIATKN